MVAQSAANYRILPGLPADGPLAKLFPSSEEWSFGEGLVVEFYPGSDHSWVGNFECGGAGIEGVFALDHLLLVVATGDGYLIDPETGACYYEERWNIQQVLTLEPLGLLISNGIWIDRLSRTHLVWRTKRISWDEMRSL